MICSIHQPTFLPYLGFFEKVRKSDVFIVYDDAQFVRRDFFQRNFILLNKKPFMLHVPLIKPKPKEKIKNVLINSKYEKKGMNWEEYHLLQIRDAYKNTKNFNRIYPQLEHIYHKHHKYLYKFNLDLIKVICKFLQINPMFKFSSILSKKFNITSKSTLKLIELSKAVGAEKYLSGINGKKYIDESLFKKNNMKLSYNNFIHPQYNQNNAQFIKNLSALDYIFRKNENL